MKRAHWIITGRVQGVGYRMFAYEEAQALGLTGWVRNLPDRDVELVAEGEPAALARLLARCQEGPCMGRVDRVEESYSAATGEFQDFRITF